MSAWPLVAIILVLSLLGIAGCATYSDKLRDARVAARTGNSQEALAALNSALKVSKAEELPASLKDDTALLLLERASVLLQMNSYRLSARDLSVADKQVEVLDLSRSTSHELGKFLFSDDVGPYRALAYEKLLINTFGMLNRLAVGDLRGARVEARRFSVMQRYVDEHEGHSRTMSALGSYLAGYVFEKSGSGQEAARFYAYAAEGGIEADNITSVGFGARSGTTATQPGMCELLLVVGHGHVPAKIARRIPVGLALTLAAGGISPANHARANRLAAQGLVTWVNFPTLEKPDGANDSFVPTVRVNGQPVDTHEGLAIDARAYEAWQAVQGKVIAAAIVRLLARTAVGVGTQAAAKGALGLVLGLGSQAALTAADKPDTRSWSLLPGRLRFVRVQLPPGPHEIQVQLAGSTRTFRTALKPGQFQVIAAIEED